jgi:S-adenosyl-L-methionine hydrolase (adenosine-forming)
MMRGLLTFLSDFGETSPYPAAMKAAAAAICSARLMDISHGVPPGSVRGGAYLLWSVAPVCPVGTVHCAVVDPGVGTKRAALAIATGEQIFVGPDNGVLIPAARRLGITAVYRLTEPAYWRHPVSATFHGRDIFAPAAAHLATGIPIASVGEPALAFVDLAFPPGHVLGDQLRGEVLWVDTFGNLITSIPGALLSALPGTGGLIVEAARGSLRAAIGRTFGDVLAGRGVVLVGSDGMVEVALNRGNAAAQMAAEVGTMLRIRREG